MSSVKISLNDDVRRVKVDLTQPDCYDNILVHLKVAFNLPSDARVTLKYHDDEDELITLSSSAELVEASRVSSEAGRKNLKLFAFVANDEAKSDAGSFIDLKVTEAASPAEPVQAVEPANVSSEDKNAVIIEDCSDDEQDVYPSEPLVSDEKVPSATVASSDSTPQSAPVPVPAPANAENPVLDAPTGLDLDEVVTHAVAFLANPKVMGVLGSFLPSVMPSLRSGEVSVSAALDKLLTALEPAGPEVRHHSFIKLVEAQRDALLPLAEHALGILRSLGDFDITVSDGFSALPAFLDGGVSGLNFGCPSASPFQSSQEDSKDGKAVHHGIRCDGCDASPLTGVRYKCTQCRDYDLCESCEAKGLHPTDHVLLKINRPPSNVDSQGRVLHRNVTCDGCGQSPLAGPRFKCSVCPNYDLCEQCERAGKHTLDHPLLKIRQPVQHRPSPGCSIGRFFPLFAGMTRTGPHGRGWARRPCGARPPHCRRPCAPTAAPSVAVASFVKDFTLPDKSYCLPNVTLRKTWLIRNDGAHEWPLGVKLVLESGTVLPAEPLTASVPQAGPGETVPVSIDIRTPSSSGHHFGYYRLAQADGTVFGDRFWVEVNVTPGQPPAPAGLLSPVSILTPDELKAKSEQPPNSMRPLTPPAQLVAPAPSPAPAGPVVSAPVAAPVPPAPVTPAPPASQYENHLQLLLSMGFGDRSANLRALAATQGDVQAAIERLLN